MQINKMKKLLGVQEKIAQDVISELNSKGIRVNWIKKRKGIEKVGVEIKVEGRSGRAQ